MPVQPRCYSQPPSIQSQSAHILMAVQPNPKLLHPKPCDPAALLQEAGQARGTALLDRLPEDSPGPRQHAGAAPYVGLCALGGSLGASPGSPGRLCGPLGPERAGPGGAGGPRAQAGGGLRPPAGVGLGMLRPGDLSALDTTADQAAGALVCQPAGVGLDAQCMPRIGDVCCVTSWETRELQWVIANVPDQSVESCM